MKLIEITTNQDKRVWINPDAVHLVEQVDGEPRNVSIKLRDSETVITTDDINNVVKLLTVIHA